MAVSCDLHPEPCVVSDAGRASAYRLALALLAALTLLAGWGVALWLCLQALLLTGVLDPLRVAVVVAATLPATGSVLVARRLLGLDRRSPWTLLGVLPSLAGGYLLVGLL